MRICVLKESLTIGGNERSAANVAKLLCNENDVLMTVFDARNAQYEFGGKLVDLQLPPKKTVVGKVLNSFIRAQSLKKMVCAENVDIVYLFTTISNYQTFVRLKNTAKIISARDFGAVRKYTWKYHLALRKSKAMICNSEYIKNYYISKYPEHKDKVFAVHNVIDSNEIAERAAENVEPEYIDFIDKHNRTISVVGRFCKEKGFEFMLAALAKAAKHVDLGLVMVGGGSYKEKYDQVISDLNLEDRVYFTGFQNNPYKYMTRSDIFVLSSISEGFPNVLAEAMSLGLPVIATNCYSGPAEILRNDQNYEAVTTGFEECDYGILTPRMMETGNEEAITALASAIEYLVQDESLLDKYAKLAKRRAADFSPQVAQGRFREIFEKIING